LFLDGPRLREAADRHAVASLTCDQSHSKPSSAGSARFHRARNCDRSSGLVVVACIGGIDLADYGRAKFDGPRRREAALRHQAADWISPVNAARTASSRSASVKPSCSCSRATARSTKTPRFSNGTRAAAAQTARSCESVKASMAVMVLSRRDGCQSLSLHHRPSGI